MKVATMCSGIGSPEQALKELNIEHENIFACEKDPFARKTYLANFHPGVMLKDMTKEDWSDSSLYADLVVAGIPCQSFSLAGKRLGEKDPRGLLIYDFIKYVKKQQPKVFIIENVKGLLSDAGGTTFSKWCELLGHTKNKQAGLFTNPDSCGYNLYYKVLNCKNYGLPQNRERIFIIGIRPDIDPETFRWPKPEILKDRLIDLLEDEVDEKYYLSDTALKYLTNDSAADYDISVVGRINKSQDGQVFDPAGISQALSAGHGNMPKVIVNNEVKKVGQLPGFESNGRIYDANAIAKTQTTKTGGGAGNSGYYMIEHRGHKNKEPTIIDTGIAPTLRSESHGHETKVAMENRIRRLTPLECMRLMGYPDSFIKPCSETQIYKQAGNSIPVKMMKAVLRQLLPILMA